MTVAPGKISVGKRWVLGAVIIAETIFCAIGLEALGRSTRVIGNGSRVASGRTQVLVVRTDAEVVRSWRARGLRGRVVVHFGRFLHFVDDAANIAQTIAAPGRGRLLDEALISGAGPQNYLRVAEELNIARRVEFVSPPASLAARLSDIGLTPANLPLNIDDGPLARKLNAAPPSISEPVLVDVNASWFDEIDPASLIAELQSAQISSDLVTVSLAEDAADVSDRARERALAFARSLAAGTG